MAIAIRRPGASYGGYVALQVASAVPDRVERLVLLDAAADLVEPDESLREVWRQEQSLVEIGDLAGATELMVDTWLGPDADDDHWALLRDMQRRAFDLQVAAGDEGANRDLPVDLARITASVTVVVGHHDLSFFRATARVLADGLPHADLVELAWGRAPAVAGAPGSDGSPGSHGPGMNLWPRTGSRHCECGCLRVLGRQRDVGFRASAACGYLVSRRSVA